MRLYADGVYSLFSSPLLFESSLSRSTTLSSSKLIVIAPPASAILGYTDATSGDRAGGQSKPRARGGPKP
jgi:hypothetical protein